MHLIMKFNLFACKSHLHNINKESVVSLPFAIYLSNVNHVKKKAKLISNYRECSLSATFKIRNKYNFTQFKIGHIQIIKGLW